MQDTSQGKAVKHPFFIGIACVQALCRIIALLLLQGSPRRVPWQFLLQDRWGQKEVGSQRLSQRSFVKAWLSVP